MTDFDMIQRVRASADISTVIGEHVKLKKIGSNFTGLCPFHSEKTPSFTVSPAKQVFHCHGCHVGGDVFTFIQRLESASFPRALHILAERAGIPLDNSAYNPRERDRSQDAARQLAEECAFFYSYIRRRFYFRHDEMFTAFRMYDLALSARTLNESNTFHALTRREHYGRRVATWRAALRRLDATKPTDLLRRYSRVRATHRRIYTEHCQAISNLISAVRGSK